jgi:hypothetical protein
MPTEFHRPPHSGDRLFVDRCSDCPSRPFLLSFVMASQGGLSLQRFGVGIDHVAGLILAGRQDYLRFRHIAELVEAVALDVLELRLQNARLRPLAIGAELDIADHSLERRLPHIIRELAVVQTLGCCNRLPQDLQIGVAPRREIITERIDARRLRSALIFVEQLLRPREHHRLHRHPKFVVDEAIKQRAELHFERSRLQADHRPADHLRL